VRSGAGALQSFQSRRLPPDVAAWRASSRNSPPVQSSWLDEVPRLLVPRSHHAVSRFLGCVVFLRRAAPSTVKRPVRPLFEFRVPPESCQRYLASRSQPAGTSLGLSFPTALAGSEVNLSRAYHARYVPPAGFGYPLGGLLLPSPCQLYFTPAALLGFALRSFLLSEGIHRVSAGMRPRAVSPVGYPAAEAMGRPNGPRLLGFDPSGSPWRPDGG
jgi:hypothetical protein